MYPEGQVTTAQNFSLYKKQATETNTLTLGPGCPFSPLSPCEGRGGRGQQPTSTGPPLCTHTSKVCSEGHKAEQHIQLQTDGWGGGCCHLPITAVEAGVPSTSATRLMELHPGSVPMFNPLAPIADPDHFSSSFPLLPGCSVPTVTSTETGFLEAHTSALDEAHIPAVLWVQGS